MTIRHRFPVKSLSIGAAALVLGSTIATAPTVAASPDSSFGFVQSASAAELTGSAITNYTASLVGQASPVSVTQYTNSARVNIAFTVTDMQPGDTVPVSLGQYFVLDQAVNQTLTGPNGEVLGTLVGASGSNSLTFTAADNQYVRDSSNFEISADLRVRGNNATWGATGATRPIEVSVGGQTQVPGEMTYNYGGPAPTLGGQLYSIPNTAEPDLGAKVTIYPATADAVGKRLTQKWSFSGDAADDMLNLNKAWIEKNGYDHILTYAVSAWGPNGLISHNSPESSVFNGGMRDGISGAEQALNPLQLRVELVDYATDSIVFSWVPQYEGQSMQLRLVKGTDDLLESTQVTTQSWTTTDGNRYSWNIITKSATNISLGTEEIHGSPLILSPTAVAQQFEGLYFGFVSPVDLAGTSYNGTVGGQRGTYPFSDFSADALQPPTVADDTFTTGFNTPVTFSVSGNDSQSGYATMQPSQNVFVETGTKTLTNADGNYVLDDAGNVTFTPASGRAGAVSPVQYRTFNDYGSSAVGTITGTVAEPSIAVGLKVLINGQDANNPDEPLILAPGDYTATYQITNPNPYPLAAADLALTNIGAGVDVPADVVVAPGETVEVTGTVSVPKQGTVVVEGEVNASYAYTFNGQAKTITANASDPAYAAALTGTIAANPDQVRVRVGEAFSIPLLDNDATDPEGHPLDPATIKLTATDGWVENEGGSFTNEKLGITGSVVDGNFVGTAGTVEGTFAAPNYTVENTLGDVSEQTGITIEVYDYHVDLEALIGEEQQDADGTEDAFKVTIGHDKETTIQPIALPVTNTGTEPITVTGFQQVNTSDGGAGFEITLDEPVTLAPGESFTYTYDIELPVGEHVIDYKVLTVEGAVDTDPVVVVVDQEEAPAPAPTPETPVVEQEKPKTPTPVVPETGGKGVTVEAKTAAELAGSDAAVVASAQAAPAGFSVGKVGAGVLGALSALSALSALALAAWGVVTFRGRGAKDA